MDFKTIAKALGNYLFAEILCLFLALTLSAVGGGLLRLVSCICTIGVMLCIYINFAINRAREDKLQKRALSSLRGCALGGIATAPYGIMGICLLLAKGSVLPEGFYRWYKLLDAPFLQLCNFCSKDVTASVLSWGETIFLAICNLIPFGTVWVTYMLFRSGRAAWTEQ